MHCISDLSSPGFRFFSRIADLWDLSIDERCVLLGGISPDTLDAYEKSPDDVRLTRDTLERISNVVGIYRALNEFFAQSDAADQWIRRPNDAPLFSGRSALDYLLRGGFDDIAAVRRYVDYATRAYSLMDDPSK